MMPFVLTVYEPFCFLLFYRYYWHHSILAAVAKDHNGHFANNDTNKVCKLCTHIQPTQFINKYCIKLFLDIEKKQVFLI